MWNLYFDFYLLLFSHLKNNISYAISMIFFLYLITTNFKKHKKIKKNKYLINIYSKNKTNN